MAKAAVSFGVTFAPNVMEKKGVELLYKEKNKQKLLDMMKNILHKYGIEMGLDEICFVQDSAKNEKNEIIAEEKQRFLTKQMENDLIVALSGYLRDNISNTSPLDDSKKLENKKWQV